MDGFYVVYVVWIFKKNFESKFLAKNVENILLRLHIV